MLYADEGQWNKTDRTPKEHLTALDMKGLGMFREDAEFRNEWGRKLKQQLFTNLIF